MFSPLRHRFARQEPGAALLTPRASLLETLSGAQPSPPPTRPAPMRYLFQECASEPLLNEISVLTFRLDTLIHPRTFRVKSKRIHPQISRRTPLKRIEKSFGFARNWCTNWPSERTISRGSYR